MSGPEKRNVALVGASASTKMFYPAWGRLANPLWLVSASGQADLGFLDRDVPVTARLEDAIEDERVEVVFVANRSADHYLTVRATLEAGKHVLVDKPMALRVSEVDALDALAKERGVVLGGVFQWRFLPVVQAVQRWLAQGALGDVLFVNAKVYWRRDPRYFVHDRGMRAVDGGGVLIKQAIHALDLMLLFGGDALDVCGWSERRRIETDTEDVATVGLKFSQGMGLLAATTCAHENRPAEIEVVGTKGRAVFDSEGCVLVAEGGDAQMDLSACNAQAGANGCVCSGGHPHEAQVWNFLEALDDPSKLVVTPAECRRSLRVIEKVYEQAGEVVG